ncbi:MAG: hypothetical protein J6L69_07520 [Lachnospiraceae bacterium]|nr:hypothetical protein [Lachnospiraceae bacterium]
MDYLEFQNEILKIVRDIMEVNYEVNLHKVTKNNGVELVAITIGERGYSGAIPTIYLDDFYDMYVAGVELTDIANNIIAIHFKYEKKVNLTMDDISDYDQVKDKVMLKLVNIERNKEMLSKLPYRKFHDLAIVAYVLWNDEKIGYMTSNVTNDCIEMWKVDFNTVFFDGYKNMIEVLDVEICDIKDMAIRIYEEMIENGRISREEAEQIIEETADAEYPMYVITNSKKTLGAAVILYEPVLKYFYEKFQGEYYVLPSSIHEVIVVPKTDISIEEMKSMVKEINENEVDYLEVLSDNVYCYNGKKLAIA